MSRNRVNIDHLEKLVSAIEKAENLYSGAAMSASGMFHQTFKTYPEVPPSGVQLALEDFRKAVETHKDNLNAAQEIVSRTAAATRLAEKKIKSIAEEIFYVNDLKRLGAEYDPLTGERLTGKDRALAGGMLVLGGPAGKLITTTGKAIMKLAKPVTKLAEPVFKALGKNSKIITSIRNVLNPKKVKELIDIVYNKIAKDMKETKQFIEAIGKKLGDIQVPIFKKEGLAFEGGPSGGTTESLRDIYRAMFKNLDEAPAKGKNGGNSTKSRNTNVDDFDASTATNKQKGNFGEIKSSDNILNNQSIKDAGYDLVPVGKTAPTSLNDKIIKGIDGLYENTNTESGIKYVIDESKFGNSTLGKTLDGKQMSDDWLTGTKTRNNRILKAVNGDEELANIIIDALDDGLVVRVLSKVDSSGIVKTYKLDKLGNIIGVWP